MFERYVCTTDFCRARQASFALFSANLFASLVSSLPSYIFSSFLAKYVPESVVGILFTVNALLVLGAVFIIPRIFSQFRIYQIMAVSIAGMILTYGVFSVPGATLALVVPLFLIVGILSWTVSLGFDVLLETTNADETQTGTTRGIFLTIGNLAVLISALIIALVLTDGDYWKIFLLAVLACIPLLSINLFSFSKVVERKPVAVKVRDVVEIFIKDEALRRISFIYFGLQVFYTWMVIYTPLYLHNHLGFQWHDIGIMLAAALLPFVLLEIPLGKLADKYIGEKEIIIAGIVGISLMTMSFSFLAGAGLLVWTVAMFLSRVGASFMEIGTETYFFKHVDGKDGGVISVFRSIYAVARIIGALVASVALIFVPLQWAFLFFGILLLLILIPAVKLQDTR